MAVLGAGSVSKLSLRNSVLTVEQLEQSPSRQDGISQELETELRVFGCELIQSAGILLRLPQVATATAQVLFQRFYYMASLKLVAVRDIAMGAVFLASKVEETPRKVKDIVNVFSWLIDVNRGITPRVESYAGLLFNELKEGIIAGELHILCKLGFNVQVQQPHGFMMNYLQGMNMVDNEDLTQRAWNYMNDGLRTSIYVCYQPSTIACAVIYLAARVCKVKLPTNPPWWEVFDADLEDLENVSGHILSLYRKPVRKGLPLTVTELETFLESGATMSFVEPANPIETAENTMLDSAPAPCNVPLRSPTSRSTETEQRSPHSRSRARSPRRESRRSRTPRSRSRSPDRSYRSRRDRRRRSRSRSRGRRGPP
ncbi:uncharacterized protein SPPG_02504 [Spizellomyces punctatus DAOM BR117]|uniref:Cyclin-like domain-containing protein n=1 Tax=Spizellomyces punctatus (strain DAOM BR117) TaxID=645134 RepID=A0A0L0HLR1_SPIPD|nr:uncharacterized protein SPPG_02504 [Spizellomyces punctatus DAOM BR117]KND01998.1 hypothetical protein SPPG_02504 [Spizellomyces punctatus DAOM BR117]|eukprot:XP_016610037.1 hypothetical protein SPPG_02504 [Spizellomyces punctatus DAOM BR117]